MRAAGGMIGRVASTAGTGRTAGSGPVPDRPR